LFGAMDYATARLNMVESQVRTNKVTDPKVVDALLAVPRERFVPEKLRGVAYVDKDLPLGGARYLLEPMVLARLLQTAQVKPSDRVLDVGPGTGYSTAVLARLALSVVALEQEPRLAEEARRMLHELMVNNASLVTGDLAGGHPKSAPYDVILVNGALAGVPPALKAQLAEGGRLAAVIKPGAGLGQATLFTRLGDTVSGRIIFDAGTPLLPGFVPQESFVF
jgi:protein-L-isoaspartate(D-aspartate) O-methyltransferase